jgi:uncharacterized repeat protein (TIGR03803 family)
MTEHTAWKKSRAIGSISWLVLMTCLAFPFASDAQTVITGPVFNGPNGRGPGPLSQGADGNFYGTTYLGGASSGGGTFFKITPGGKLTSLYKFCSGQNCPDGGGPTGVLVLGTHGYFYGITYEGGANIFGGTVFKVTPTGTLTTLHSFCSVTNRGLCLDGANPVGGLVWGPDKSFYGITSVGGPGYVGDCISGANELGCGTAFKITPDGRLTTLYNFCSEGNYSCEDGWYPVGPLT